jgi:centromeric protein E
MLVQNEGNTKDPLTSALPDSLDEINQLRSASGEHSSITGSALDSMQVNYLQLFQ